MGVLDFLASKADAIGKGMARSVAGTAQRVSGAYDLVTPGKGTNRVSKSLDQRAKQIDAEQKAKGNNAIYKGAQIGTDVLQFLAGSGAVNAGAKVASKVPAIAKATTAISKTPVAKQITKVSDKVFKGADKLATKGLKGKAAATVIRGVANPTNLKTAPLFTFLEEGAKSGKGQDVSPGGTAVDLGLNVVTGARDFGGRHHAVPVPERGVLNINDAELSKLSNSTDPGEIKKLVSKGLPSHVAEDVSQAIATTKDPNTIKTIISNRLAKEPIPTPAVTADVPTVPGERQRGFLESAQNRENLPADLQQGISDIKPQTYTQRANDELVTTAKQIVDTNPQQALQRIYRGAKSGPEHDENVVMGEMLMRKAWNEGRKTDAIDIAEQLDVTGRKLGRGVQAFAAIQKLGPEGVKIYAAKQIRKSREGLRNAVKEKPTAKDIQSQVEGFGQEDAGKVHGDIQNTVKELANGGKQEAQTVGQKVAKNVDPGKARKKKKADELVKELSKKIKQEHLTAGKATKKNPLDVLREVFGRKGEAVEAYPEAQAILRDKYANNPKVLRLLDKFFNSELGLPAASSTVNSAIRNQLKTNGTRISQAIYKSWAEQKQSVDDIAQALTKEGFDEQSAKALAKEVTGRLNKRFADAKTATLERLAREAPEKATQTYIDKLNKLSNLGALSKHDYLDLARAKLGLPNLDEATASKLDELAQKIQGVPEGPEKYAITRQIQQLIQSKTKANLKQKVVQAFGVPRALLASSDFSFGGRQALAYATSHPIRFAQQWVKQFKYFKEGVQGGEPKAFDKMMGEIQAHPDYDLLKKSGLAINDPFGIRPSAREEQFIGGEMASKIPAIGRVVRGSDYAFTGLANSIRANEFYAQLEHARGAGIEVSDKLVKDLANVINTATGRGSVGALEKFMPTLSATLFAPRLIASRIQLFNPVHYVKLDPFARKEAIRNLISLSAFATGVLGIAKLGGLEVGTEPTSSDFGKIKVGDTRFDFLGGYTQYIRLGAQFAEGKTTSSLSNRESQLGSGYGKKSRKDIIATFLENKSNPVVSFATTLAKGTDPVGNPVNTPGTVGQQAIQRFIPLFAQDIYDVVTHEKGANPAIAAPLAQLGVGVQTYGTEDIKLTDKQNAYVSQLKDGGASKEKLKATTSFYQVLKTTPDRNKASKAINDALADGDVTKAQEIAADYNKKYAATFKEWRKQNDSYRTDKHLVKDYNAQRIKLTPASIRTRTKAIKDNPLYSASKGGQ